VKVSPTQKLYSVPPCAQDEFNTFHTFAIQVARRDALRNHLTKLGIGTAIHYQIPIHLQPTAKSLGYGMIDGPVLNTIDEIKILIAINAQANSANQGFNLITKYKHADYVCINAREAKLTGGEKHAYIEDVLKRKLLPVIDCKYFLEP